MFGFSTADRVIFKRNFLRKVSFRIDYDKSTSIINDRGSIEERFQQKFPRIVKSQGKGIQITFEHSEPKTESLEGNELYVLKSSDGGILLEISNTYIELSFEGVSYKSSQDIKEILPTIVDFLTKNMITKVNKIELNKINIIEFDSSNENPNGILHFLLNKQVISNIDIFPSTNLINYNLQTVNYKNENYSLNLKYGMNLPPIPNLKIGQVIINISTSKYTETNINEIVEVFNNSNTEIFNVFNTLINENTKDILNGK